VILSWSYQSSALGDLESHLLDIVRVADRRNQSLNVSGVLAYDASGYYQLLEGPLDGIAELRWSILRDRRHKVHTQKLEPRRHRSTPVCLPMAFIQTSIPHCALLRPGGAHAMAAFECHLLDRAEEQYPISYGQRKHTPIPCD